MALYKEGMVINPKRKKNRKVKVNPDYITTDEYCIAFEPGDVTTTYATDWHFDSRIEAFETACSIISNQIGLQPEDIIDFGIIATYNDKTRMYDYELRLVTSLDVSERLDDVYPD